MQAVEDQAGRVPERATERMQFRTRPHIKRAIQRAAALSGVDDTAFAINVLYKAAIETIEAHERMTLSSADAEVFFDALDNPKPPTDALRKIARRYHERYSAR